MINEEDRLIIQYCLGEGILIDKEVLNLLKNHKKYIPEFVFEISSKGNAKLLNKEVLINVINKEKEEKKNHILIKQIEVPIPLSRIISRSQRYQVLKRQNWNCNQCGCKLKYSQENPFPGEVAHIDHIYPYSKRKSYFNREENINELSNLQALCPICNLSKGKKEIQ